MVRIIPMCGLCRRVREDGPATRGGGRWVDLPHYWAHHVVSPWQVKFADGYCAECRLSYDIIKTHGM